MAIPSCFSKVIRGSLLKLNQCKKLSARNYGIWEPDYLILSKTKTPEYDLVNVQIKGYDFAVLENFQRMIHKLAKAMNIDVQNCWAVPHQDLRIKKFVPNTSNVEYEYLVKVYERNVQIADPKSHIMALFIEAVITACPPGVTIKFHEDIEEEQQKIFVPDYDTIELEKELKAIESGKKKK